MGSKRSTVTDMATTGTSSLRRLLAGGIVAGALFVAAPAGAQTAYSDGSDGSTGQDIDNPTGGNGVIDADGGTTPASDPVTVPAAPAADADSSGGASSGAGAGSGDLGNVDGGELAFTGGDAISLAVIGGSVLGAGALLVAAPRRNDDDQ